MRIAFTSSDGQTIDEHFGKAPWFFVWDVDPEAARCVGRLDAGAVTTGDTEDQTTARADLVRGCAIVYTLQIGGPAAAKLVARRIHPMKTGIPTPIATMVGKIQEVLAANPPPWLRRIMSDSREP